jgi:hypothetical protein
MQLVYTFHGLHHIRVLVVLLGVNRIVDSQCFSVNLEPHAFNCNAVSVPSKCRNSECAFLHGPVETENHGTELLTERRRAIKVPQRFDVVLPEACYAESLTKRVASSGLIGGW